MVLNGFVELWKMVLSGSKTTWKMCPRNWLLCLANDNALENAVRRIEKWLHVRP